MPKLTGVSGIISAAHYSKSGVLHGHTWHVLVWHDSSPELADAELRKSDLFYYLKALDHSVLPDELAWGENLAEKIGLDLKASIVEVSRPLEGIYAKWIRE